MHLRFAPIALAALVALGALSCGSTNDDAAAAGKSKFQCSNPTPEVPGYESGFERCDGNWHHRPQIVECPSTVPRADYTCQGNYEPSECSKDADCAGTQGGHCTLMPPGNCRCASGCTKDSDCGAGYVCLCGEPTGRCVASSCSSDADCSDGNLCSSYVENPACGPLMFRCQQGNDECASARDCAKGEACTVKGGRRVCTGDICTQ